MKRLCMALVGGLIVATAWAQNPRVWTNPVAPAPEVLDRLNLRLGWRTGIPVEGYRDGIATVQNLGDEIIVQTYRGTVEAIDPVTGAGLWRTTVGQPYPVIYRVGYSDAVILVANGTRIFGLDRPTGKVLWNVDLAGTPSSPPAANGDAFYVCLSNGRLSAYAFPVETAPTPATTGGAAKAPGTSGSAAAPRTPPIPARTTAAPANTIDPTKAVGGGGGRSATVSGGTGSRSTTTAMQVTGGRTAVGTADTTRGGRGSAVVGAPRLLWDYQTNLRVSERPILGEKQLLVIGTGREALFMDKTGAKPMPFTADASFSAPMAQYGEVAYAACANGSIYAFDLPTRVTLWQVTASGAITERPVATDEDLFAVADGSGLGRYVRVTGELLWNNPAVVRFVAANPKFVYGRDATGRLLVLDRMHGETLTTLDIRAFTVSLPNGQTDRMILGANDGTIVSIYDRAYPQPLRMRNPPAIVIPATPLPAGNPDDAKPETSPEPKPVTPKPVPKAPAAPPKAAPPKDAPETPPPATPPVTPPPATPPVTPPSE